MNFSLPTKHAKMIYRARWSGVAFLVEAMLLLVFVAICLTVFVQMFAAAADYARRSDETTYAVALASSMAERFSADPTSAEEPAVLDGLLAVNEVTAEPRAAGTLYHAHICVYSLSDERAMSLLTAAAEQSAETTSESSDTMFDLAEAEGLEPLYTIDTAKYESGVGTDG